MNRIEEVVQSMDLSTLFQEDKVGERLVYHVYEIHAWAETAELDIRLKLVCKDFRKFAIQYNRTPRYAVARYWDGIDDTLNDFKEGHIAKMLRELDLMMYWDMFERPRVHMFFHQYALDPDLFKVLTTMGVETGDHLDKMMMRFRSRSGAENAKTVEKLRIAAENDSVWRETRGEVVAANDKKRPRDEKENVKEAMRVILCKYDLEEDLDNLCKMGVEILDDIAFLEEADCLNLKGDLAKYKSVVAHENEANANA